MESLALSGVERVDDIFGYDKLVRAKRARLSAVILAVRNTVSQARYVIL